jgi:hypothetical protein|tara:strand:- start:27 stop:347 length:321 start_codon:yes stop_codon:yes gene_type:complete
MTDISTAIRALTPTAEWTVRGTEIEWHSKDISQPSDDAIATKIDELKAAEPMRLLRVERDRLIAATDWWASSDLTMSSTQTKYRQDLRDITKTATSLDDVTWPTKP